VHEKGRAEALIGDARQAIKEEAPLDRLRSLTSELQQVYQSLGVGGGAAGGATAGSAGQQQGAQGSQGCQDDDVIDAEFTTG
jgi:molecular chaperone DnaK